MSHQSELISTDINAYLAQHERKELLRFLTCGNVDDGKSTLIGRLLHDSKMIYEDQLAAVKADSVKSGTTGAGNIDLALLVDGLQAEREQGITIDVAYRYFSTSTRKFIIADTPGHEQYTRNMATGASTCDLAVILIDARYGVQTQTKRHSFIASLLGIKHIIVAINKMDLVGYAQESFEKIKSDYLNFVGNLNLQDIHFIPMSALDGDNVVNPSPNMPWFTGKTMMELLNSIEIASDHNFIDARLPVQYVNRPNLDFRGFSGTIASGVFKPGDAITVLPSAKTSRINRIVTFDGDLAEAFAGMAVTFTLEDEIDISRGDIIVGQQQHLPCIGDKFRANLVWMTEQAMTPGKQYLIKLATRSVSGSIAALDYRIDVNSLKHHDADELKLNEIGVCQVAVQAPVVFEPYQRNKTGGAFIVIDRLSNVTVGAGMIIGEVDSETWSPVSPKERADRFGQTPACIVISGAEALTAAYRLERKLFDTGHAAVVLEQTEPGWLAALKSAGLLAITTDQQTESNIRDGVEPQADLHFNADAQNLDQIYAELKRKGIIHG